MKKIKGLFLLMRFELPFSAGVCVVMGQLLALGEFASSIITIAGFLSVFSISASILVSNDYFDVETDRINAPHRPIPANMVSPSEALFFSIILLLLGFALSYLVGIEALIFSACLALIGFLYNRQFKKNGLLGNLLVSFSVGMTFIYGGLTVNAPFNKMVLFFGLIAALIDLGEEIAADAMDIEGDRLINSKSLAIKFGKSTALKISVLIFSFVVLITSLPFLLSWFSLIYLVPILLMDFFIIFSAIKLVMSKNEEGRSYIRLLYLGSTLGLFVFLIMRLIGI